MAELERRRAEDPGYRREQEAAEKERAESAVRRREAERPLLADLAELGIDVTSVWDLHKVPDAPAKAIPVLLDHLTRDYPDHVLMGIGVALEGRAARAWWPRLSALYVTTNSPVVRDRLAAVLSSVATRAHYEELIAFIGAESLGDTRLYFLRPVNRIGNRMSAGAGRVVVEAVAGDPVFAKEARAILAGRSRNA